LLFKITRFSASLKSFGSTLKASSKEFGILVVYLAIGVIFFSTIVYFIVFV
jgi:potassium voltage-gated channel Shab-related subfamily B protein 2